MRVLLDAFHILVYGKSPDYGSFIEVAIRAIITSGLAQKRSYLLFWV